jgi:hypothetical protein
MIRALLITALAAALSYAACDSYDSLNRQPKTTTHNPARN